MFCVNDSEFSLEDIVEHIESFEIFDNGEAKKISQEEKDFSMIKLNLKNLFSSSRLMPAFGVSLHNETIKEMQKDIWLKINFNNVLNKNGLPFSSLLFKLENVQGFNLIRFYNNKYDGRCLYLDLDNSTDLKSLITSNLMF